QLVLVAAEPHPVAVRLQFELDRVGRADAGRRDDPLDELTEIALAFDERDAPALELAGEQDLVDDRAQSLGLALDHLQEGVLGRRVQLEVVAAERLDGYVNRRERRGQLIARRGREL